MGELTAKPLTAGTWPDFERLVQAHNGVWGGRWCMAFHPARDESRRNPEANREDKLGGSRASSSARRIANAMSLPQRSPAR